MWFCKLFGWWKIHRVTITLLQNCIQNVFLRPCTAKGKLRSCVPHYLHPPTGKSRAKSCFSGTVRGAKGRYEEKPRNTQVKAMFYNPFCENTCAQSLKAALPEGTSRPTANQPNKYKASSYPGNIQISCTNICRNW